MVMIPGELISAANRRQNELIEKNNALTIKLLQVTQNLAAVVEQYGTKTEEGTYVSFPEETLNDVFFDPMVAINFDPITKFITLFRPKSGSAVKAPAPSGYDPNWQQP